MLPAQDLKPNTVYNIKIIVKGADISVYRDGALMLKTSYATFNASGQVGFYAGGFDYLLFDDIEFKVPTTDVVGIQLDRQSLNMVVDEETVLSVTFDPSDAAERGLIWQSSNPKAATVDENGKITALAKGETTITVTSVANPGASASAVVMVSDILLFADFDSGANGWPVDPNRSIVTVDGNKKYRIVNGASALHPKLFTSYDLSFELKMPAVTPQTGTFYIYDRSATGTSGKVGYRKLGDGTAQWILYDPSWQVLAKKDVPHEDLLPGATYQVRMIVDGASIRVFVDGELKLSGNDPNHHPSGTIGFYVSGFNEMWFDNVTFTLIERNAAATELFYDDFENGNFDRWTDPLNAGKWYIATEGSNHVLRSDNAGLGSENIIFAGNTEWENYSVEAEVKLVNAVAGGTRGSGILARVSDLNRFYLLRLNQAGSVDLMRKNGTYTTLASKPFTVAIGETYALKLIVDGNKLSAYVDDELMFSVVDGDLPAGKIGLRAYGHSVAIDHVRVTMLEANKTALLDRINEATVLMKQQYTELSWQQFQTALDAANETYESRSATQPEVNDSMNALSRALAGLIKPGRTDGMLEEVPYKMDVSNQAGWWGPLKTKNGITYMAFNEPSLRPGYHYIAVAIKDENGDWKKIPAMNGTTRAEFINDLGHNQPSIALDGDGNLHMFASMHHEGWKYFRSDPVSGTLQNRSSSLPNQAGLYTYPVVTNAPNGDLWLLIRSGGTDRRIGELFQYNSADGEWSKVAAFANEQNRSVYPDDIKVDAEGNVHILFEWAPYPANAIRHVLTYAKYVSSEGKVYKADGTELAFPLTTATGDIIQPLTEGENFQSNEGVQSAKLVLDDNNRPLVAYRYKTAANPDIFEVKFARFDGGEWIRETVFSLADTKAAIDITSHGSEIRIYYATAAGADRARVSVFADGVWQHDVLAPGIPIERLSVESSAPGSDILYLTDITNTRLYYGRKDSVIVAPELPPVWSDGVLSATNVSASGVTLTWSGISEDEVLSGYRLYNGSNEIIELSGDVTSYRVTGLTADTAYTFKVEAGSNKNVWSTNGPSVNVRTAADADFTDLQDAINQAQLLTETSVGTEPGEVSQDALDALSAAIEAAQVVLGNLNATQSEINNARDDLLSAVEQFEASIIVAPELPPVWSDGVLSATNVGVSAVTLTWSGISEDEAVSGYKLYNGSNEIIELSGDVTSYRVTGLTADTAYTFKVEAGSNKNVWSTNGPSVTVRTSADVCYSCMPVDPVTPPVQEPEKSVDPVVPVESQRAKFLARKGLEIPGRLSIGGSTVEVARDPAAAETLLREPITITLSYEPARSNVALLGVYYFNETTGHWEYVGAITEGASHQFKVTVRHAGIYSVMEYDRSFDDVPQKHWAHLALKEMAAKHIVNGVSDRLFKPTGMTTRAEFATLLVRALGLQSAGAHSFADVPSDAWYASAVGAANEANLIKGVSANEFGPDKMISREEMAVMLVRAYEYANGKLPVLEQGAAPLNDSNRISSWAESEVAAAIALGLMQGKGQGYFDPKTPTQRAESIQAVWNLLQLIK
ncbi:hypothetical protein PAT3040_00481 [Paenibacillus agaridevorans]|uniref:S-layer protein n=1 Tax=Paenibacillus agaridevorans TaxID=171404 RepID=A0A2R5ERG7_9BACL|nr:hypothetical protein PAT3040_00481 [Paenibacillus agaridevorans]